VDNRLRGLDLNLLVTLDMLLTEQNVTRTAQRLHYSQPSVSVQLAKLRDVFDDPLLLPGPRGMRPTKRAEQLREPLREALGALERAVAPPAAFDPVRAQETWRLAATDYAESTIVLPALRRLRPAAPMSRLAVVEMVPPRFEKQAEQGEIDLAFHTVEGAPDNMRRRVLFAERYVLIGRADHPRLKRRPTLTQFCKLEHAIVSPDGGGFHGVTDEALRAIGLTRRVILSVPHFLFLVSAVTNSDLVAMAPLRLVQDNPALRITEPPVDVPGYEMCMLWHERAHRDPAHRWLREHIAASV